MTVSAGRSSLMQYLANMGTRFSGSGSILEIGIAGDRDSAGNTCPGANREHFKADRYVTADIDPAEHPDLVLDIQQPDGILTGITPFDVVLCSQTLEHVWDLRSAARSLYLLTKPGGWCLVDTPWLAPEHYGGEKCGDWWRLTAPALRRLMREYGGFSSIESYQEPEHLCPPGEPKWVAAVCKREEAK